MAEGSFVSELGLKLKKTIVAVMIEMLQNICYHGSDKIESSTDKPGLILVSEDEDRYSMITGNYIANNKIEKFMKHVEQINIIELL